MSGPNRDSIPTQKGWLEDKADMIARAQPEPEPVEEAPKKKAPAKKKAAKKTEE